MSIPELHSNIPFPEDKSQVSLTSACILMDYMLSSITKSQERLQTMFNSIVTQHQNFNLQMEPQALSGSDISLYKVNYLQIYVSYDIDPEQLYGVYYVSRTYLEFSMKFLILTLTHIVFELRRSSSHPSVVTYSLTPPSLPPVECFVSADLAPDSSAGLNYGWCNHFELLRIISSQHFFTRF